LNFLTSTLAFSSLRAKPIISWNHTAHTLPSTHAGGLQVALKSPPTGEPKIFISGRRTAGAIRSGERQYSVISTVLSSKSVMEPQPYSLSVQPDRNTLVCLPCRLFQLLCTSQDPRRSNASYPPLHVVRFLSKNCSILHHWDTFSPAVMASNLSLSLLSSTNARSMDASFLSNSWGDSNSTTRPASKTIILSASIIV